MVQISSLATALLLVTHLNGFEPPSVPPTASIEQGETAFIGRVLRITEKERGKYQTKAVAEIEIRKVIKGSKQKNKKVRLVFVSQTLVDNEVSLPLRISEDILFVLTGLRKSGQEKFNSSVEDGFDAAFVFDEDYKDKTGKKHILRSIYMPQMKFEFSSAEIDSLSALYTNQK